LSQKKFYDGELLKNQTDAILGLFEMVTSIYPGKYEPLEHHAP
jgi:hypothetical protein